MNTSTCLEAPPFEETEDTILAILPKETPSTVFPEEIRNMGWWIDRAEEFAREFLDVDFKIRDRFIIPDSFPWKHVIPIFDPSGLTSSEALTYALCYQGLDVWGGVAGRVYDGWHGSSMPSLHFMEFSVRPSEDTMGKSPAELRTSQEEFLTMRQYILAYGLYWFAVGKRLDETSPDGLFDKHTSTLFPDDRLPGPGLRREACALTRGHELMFTWQRPDESSPDCGARRAFPAALKV